MAMENNMKIVFEDKKGRHLDTVERFEDFKETIREIQTIITL